MQPIAFRCGRFAAYASRHLPNYPLDNKLQHIYNVFMNSVSFSWDDLKNIANQKKHRVSFEEAQSIFFDEHAIEYYDPDHSESEDRFLMLGLSYQVRVLVVSYTLRKDGTEIRIISAKIIFRRKIMRKEYDFSKMKGRKNPYAKRLKKQVTIRLGVDIIEHFKRMSEDTGIPYQNLINLYLRDCVQSSRKISIKWSS